MADRCPPLSGRARHHQIQAPLQSSGPPSSSSLTGSCVPLSVCRYPDDYIVQSEVLGQVKAGLQANLKKSELGYLGSMESPLWCRDGWEVVVGSSRCMCNTSFFLRKALSTIDCFCSFNIEESQQEVSHQLQPSSLFSKMPPRSSSRLKLAP